MTTVLPFFDHVTIVENLMAQREVDYLIKTIDS